MKFLYPDFLWAFAVLAIPVIIHLFNFRRFRRILFTNVRFLMDIEQTTSSRRRLKHLLVLLCRLLAFSFLVLAFAQPYFPKKEKAATSSVSAISVYIDNSFSMTALSKEGELLENAKRLTRELASSYKASDRFMLITNDFEGQHHRLLPREDFLRLVDEVQISPASRKLSDVYKKQKLALESSGLKEKICYQISDFQESTADIENINPDSTIQLRPVFLKAEKKDNISLDTCWMETPYVQPNQPAKLKVRVKSYSGQNVENASVSLKLNQVQKALGNFSLKPGAEAEVELIFTPDRAGWQHAELSITDYPVIFDDKLYLSFPVEPGVSVLCINNGPADKNIGSVYGSDPYYKLTQVPAGQIDYSTLGSYRLIILNGISEVSSGLEQELRKYTARGGSLMIFPPAQADKAPPLSAFLNNFISVSLSPLDFSPRQVETLNRESEVFSNMFEKVPSNLDLPKVNKHYPIVRKGFAHEEVLMKLDNRDIFLAAYRSGAGLVYLCASAPEAASSNFQDHWSFVPFMLKVALMNSNNIALYETIGSEKPVPVLVEHAGNDQAYHLKADKFDMIPELVLQDGRPFIFTGGQVKKDGVYTLTGSGSGSQLVSFNYSRAESPVNVLSPEDLAGRGFEVLNPDKKSLAQLISEQSLDNRLWKLCILLALLFLAIEVLLLRFLK